MQDIEPHYRWENLYVASRDERSPFYERLYNLDYYENAIYSYYIHPMWDEIGSETLYCKILFADYERNFAIIEMFGEWNDTLHNDIMYFKRVVIDHLVNEGISKFILLGENVLNFHGSYEDDYYAEWFEDVEDGWIAACNFPDHVATEFAKYNLDIYINMGGTLNISNWLTMKPLQFFDLVNGLIVRRLL